ncbi:DUF2847 family protein [Neolewinella lacunae]|uniref:DUF2847 family protein n=1 Tax=Neolewinella lacunae TaxID=1517758 RepID=A0A923TAE7_9BACT|nr:monothiol bacilliredoxin BrxC family protein [Neolewinella lacunae]MBC6996088.1 DUF2847 family protein [Neolewinella lacunae]MDN3633941.1 DUF2847 family protein [Neolewinella lacunae]
MFHIMHNTADFDAALAASHEQAIVLFKHSASCPFSAVAQLEVAHAKDALEVYGIVVQYTEALKIEIAERLGIAHRSPQAIIIHKGEAKAEYWRSQIKEKQLKEAIRALG